MAYGRGHTTGTKKERTRCLPTFAKEAMQATLERLRAQEQAQQQPQEDISHARSECDKTYTL
jgi:hypothetical protein